MIKRPLIFAGFTVFLVLVGLRVLSLSQRSDVAPLHVSRPSAWKPAAAAMSGPTPAVAASVKATALGLWVQPPPEMAARNHRRCSFGATLKPLGASDGFIDKLADGDIRGAIADLKRRAKTGDASAGNQLDYLAHATCPIAASSGLGDALSSQSFDATGLSAADGGWIRAAMQQRLAYNQHLSAICHQDIDREEADAWVNASAAGGDPDSHYLLAMFGANRTIRDEHLVVAADGGVPWAQLGLAQRILQGAPIDAVSLDSDEHAVDLMRAAAAANPAAQSQLASCEFMGCGDIEQDSAAAVEDAREAAQHGAFGAMLQIGPQLPASQIDPDEVEAWNLIHAALEMQGFAGTALNTRVIQSAAGVLNSLSITPQARNLAERYWRDYGAQILASLGCGTLRTAGN